MKLYRTAPRFYIASTQIEHHAQDCIKIDIWNLFSHHKRPTRKSCQSTRDQRSFFQSTKLSNKAVHKHNMANSDVCNILPPLTFAKKTEGTIELSASAEAASNHPTHTHPEVDRSVPLESASKIHKMDKAESRRGSVASPRKVVFCLAVVMVMTVVGFPLVLLGINGTKPAADLVPGVENGVNGARSSMFVSRGRCQLGWSAGMGRIRSRAAVV